MELKNFLGAVAGFETDASAFLNEANTNSVETTTPKLFGLLELQPNNQTNIAMQSMPAVAVAEKCHEWDPCI